MFNWNHFPVTRNQLLRLTSPIGCLYNVNEPIDELQRTLTDTVLTCNQCQGFYNKHCTQSGTQWNCVLCGGVNEGVGSVNQSDDYTYCYKDHEETATLIIDLNTPQDEFEVLITELVQAIRLHDDLAIAVITFDKHCYLWDPQHSTTFTFRDEKSTLNKSSSVFCSNVARVEEYLLSLSPVVNDSSTKRPLRATGLALSIASTVSKESLSLLFVSGPCTVGPGQVVSLSKRETIRTFNDITKGRAKLMDKARTFYKSLKDLYVCSFISSLDQTGLFEMQSCMNSVTLVDSFNTNLFKQSLSQTIESGSIAQMEVLTSKEITIRGFLGPGAINKARKSGNLNDEPLGKSGSNSIKFVQLSNTSMGILFHMDTVAYASERSKIGSYVYVQIRTWVKGKLRVTTLKKPTLNNEGVKLENGFNQEAWIVLLMRLYCWQELQMKDFDYNQRLVQLFQKFGTFIPQEPDTFQLPQNFRLLPHIWQHLPCTPIVQIVNKTPDEWCYYALTFSHVDLHDCMKILYPLLLEFDTDKEREVPLTASSIKSNVILLMDTYFHVIVHWGSQVSQWNETSQDHEGITKMIESTRKYDIGSRLPLPRYVQCVEGDSQSRFLKAQLDDDFIPWWDNMCNTVCNK
ncbi:vWA-like protein [Cyberlindnera jadinii NRRL Y-1542]|uniref:Protein transport protein SEC23 n=1 Tax=Cyberlindnera jadinii (strain ATCC 18201 / CBS 1600 / BCRC 20928 / JCM 3617 / NBRC 0987 / NRRL Y-1542) TaxID=983966 RepID=A0A1E4RVZ5_CYBJN|nr:vWA-like protein [Cyberlindnera jadinii NRRL Y-1542]ODV71416.1 vWA-like protein [Cyberlindnera jadinii NRRL Y-1542]